MVDFGTRTDAQAREYPVLYDIVRDRVKPHRDANNDRLRRTYWWRFGRTNVKLREAVKGLQKFIATPYVSKHRFFVFLDTTVAPDEKIVCVASDDPFLLGVLSSKIHIAWALAAGTRLETRPTYNNSLCFDPFPFPNGSPDEHKRVVEVAERIHAHREAGLADEAVTQPPDVPRFFLGSPSLVQLHKP